ncbi:hypothetical protein DOY81_015005 [Sarcophaga bullata]|nr:hypothetical protein DOY81_015005 [Sarcophaga bullata]
MCDPSSNQQKWTCDYCTYENFPSAIKCTMCKGVKPMVNEDIFRLSPPQISYENDGEAARGAVADVIDVEPSSFNAYSSSQRDTQNSVEAATEENDTSNKWSCKMCTYLNWPRSLRCVQCYTKRGVALDTSPSQDIGAISVASFKQQQQQQQQQQHLISHNDLEQNATSTKRLSDNLDSKTIIDYDGTAARQLIIVHLTCNSKNNNNNNSNNQHNTREAK